MAQRSKRHPLRLSDVTDTRRARRRLVQQFVGIRAQLARLSSKFLISQRNSVAFGELVKEVYRGGKRIAIVFGVGHMPDLERRLQEEFDYRLTKTEWFDALYEDQDLAEQSRLKSRNPEAPRPEAPQPKLDPPGRERPKTREF